MATDIVLFSGAKPSRGYDRVILSRIRSLREIRGKSGELMIAEAKNLDDARKAAENKNVDIIYGLEHSDKKDSLHFRTSGLNQVICKLCKANNIAIAVPIADIINSRSRSLLMGRIMQNIRLCSKYKVRMVAASFAKNSLEQRSADDVESLLRTLGMTASEAKQALNNAEDILKDKKGIVRAGIRLTA